ncbi:MAG: MarC family protein, partial [archaeon]
MLAYFLSVLIPLFIVVDSIGNVPVFFALLGKYSKAEKTRIIFRSTFIAFIVFALFSIFGNYLLDWMGIRIYSFQIAGGILLFIIALEMLFGQRTRTEHSEGEIERSLEKKSIAVTPLAIPLLTGPGAITSGLIFFGIALSQPSFAGILSYAAVFLLAAFTVYLISFIVLVKSRILYDLLGVDGTLVVTRIMGLVLAGFAVQMFANGALTAL